MTLQEHADALVAATGDSHAMVLMGLDGLAIAVAQTPAAPPSPAAQLTAMAPWLRGLVAAAGGQGGNQAREVVVAGPQQTWVVRWLGPRHLAAMLLGPGAWPGRARFALGEAAAALEEALKVAPQ